MKSFLIWVWGYMWRTAALVVGIEAAIHDADLMCGFALGVFVASIWQYKP